MFFLTSSFGRLGVGLGHLCLGVGLLVCLSMCVSVHVSVFVSVRAAGAAVAPMRLWRLKQGLRWALRCRALPRVCWEMVRNKKLLMAIHVLMMVVTYCRPGELLDSEPTGPMHGVASDWTLLCPPCSTRRAEQNSEPRRHNRPAKPNLSLDHQSGCSPWRPASLRKDFRAPTRGLYQRVSKSNTCTGPKRHCSVPVPPLDKAGLHRTMLRDQKRGRWKPDNGLARYEKSVIQAQIQSDLNKSQVTYLRATDIALEDLFFFGRHRVEDVLPPSLMVADSLSGPFCLTIGWAVQPKDSECEPLFRNLKDGARYDVAHPVNLRPLLTDIANGEILGCMMSVPSTGWNVARCCCRPLRSSAQPWGIEKSRVSMSPSDPACLDTGNRIMRAVNRVKDTVTDRQADQTPSTNVPVPHRTTEPRSVACTTFGGTIVCRIFRATWRCVCVCACCVLGVTASSDPVLGTGLS